MGVIVCPMWDLESGAGVLMVQSRPVCGERCLLIPAALAACRQANHTVLQEIGTSARQCFTVPGKGGTHHVSEILG